MCCSVLPVAAHSTRCAARVDNLARFSPRRSPPALVLSSAMGAAVGRGGMAPGGEAGWDRECGGEGAVVRKNMEISDQLRQFIRTTFLRGDDLELSDSTPLLTSGLLDSTDALELLLYMESEFDITVGDDESGPENLDTLERITAFIEAKRGAGGAREGTREGSEPLVR